MSLQEGGNDHELAYQNFTAKKGREVKEEKARAVQKAAKKVLTFSNGDLFLGT